MKRNHLLFILMLINLSDSSKGNFKSSVIKNYLTRSVVQSVVYKYFDDIIRNYFKNEMLLIIHWSNISAHFLDEFIQYFATSGLITLQLCDCDRPQQIINKKKYQAKNTVILWTETVLDSEKMKMITQCQFWNSRSQIIVLSLGLKTDFIDSLLGQIWALTKAINVILMLIKNSSVHFFTLCPYHNFKIKELDFKINNNAVDLFPDKIPVNFNGSVIYVGTTTFVPYVLSPKLQNDFLEGLEIRIFQTLSEHFNFRVRYRLSPKGENPWIVRSPENKIVGLFGLLTRLEIDIAFHGIRIRDDRYEISDWTVVHTFDSLSWVYPRKMKIHEWKSLFVIFESNVWYSLFVCIIIATFAIYYISRFQRTEVKKSRLLFSDGYFFTIAAILVNTENRKVNGVALRTFMVSFFFFALNITFAYQSCLIMRLTSPHSEQLYKTLKDVVDGGLIAHLHPAGASNYNVSDHDLWVKIFTPQEHLYTMDYEYTYAGIAYNKTIYSWQPVSLTEFYTNHQFLDENNQPMMYIDEESIIPYLVCMYLSKGHPLTDFISINILRLVEAGLVEFFEKDLELRYNTRRRKHGIGKAPKPLSLNHLQSAFFIAGFMFIISCLILGYELLLTNKKA